MIPRRLTVFCKLVIASFVMGFNKNFKVRVPKWRFDERHQKLGEYEDWEACESSLQIGHLFGRNGFSEIFTARAPNWRSDDKLEKQAKKDYYEASKSDLQIAYLLGVIRFSENFPVKAQKCDYDGKHQITRWKRWFRGVCQNFGNRLSFAS